MSGFPKTPETEIDLFNIIFNSIKTTVIFCNQWTESIGKAIYGEHAIILPHGGAVKFIDPFGCKGFIISNCGFHNLVQDNGYFLCTYISTKVEGFDEFRKLNTTYEDLSHLGCYISTDSTMPWQVTQALNKFYIRPDLTFLTTPDIKPDNNQKQVEEFLKSSLSEAVSYTGNNTDTSIAGIISHNEAERAIKLASDRSKITIKSRK